jgi:hypothetical protein
MRYGSNGKICDPTGNDYEKTYEHGAHEREIRMKNRLGQNNNNQNRLSNSSKGGRPAQIVTVPATTHINENGSVSNVSHSNSSRHNENGSSCNVFHSNTPRQSDITFPSSMPSNSSPLGFDLDDISIGKYSIVNEPAPTSYQNIARSHFNTPVHMDTNQNASMTNDSESYGDEHYNKHINNNDSDIFPHQSNNNLQKKFRGNLNAHHDNGPIKNNPYYSNQDAHHDPHNAHEHKKKKPKLTETELQKLCHNVDLSTPVEDDIRIVSVNQVSTTNQSLPNSKHSAHPVQIPSPPEKRNHNGKKINMSYSYL